MLEASMRLRLPILLAIGLFACGPRPATKPFGAIAPLATAPASDGGEASARHPPPLGARRLARIRAADRAIAATVSEWRLAPPPRACLVIFDEAQEWVLRCPEAATWTGSVATADALDGAPVFWNAPSIRRFDDVTPYESAKTAIVASYETSYRSRPRPPLTLVQDWDALHRNHPGFQSAPLEEWLGVVVHEAFHARQFHHPRVQGELEAHGGLDASPLEALYARDARYRASVAAEHGLLRGALLGQGLDAGRARSALAAWLRLYDARHAAFGEALDASAVRHDGWWTDGMSTFLEGTARYVEAQFLARGGDLEDLLGDEPHFGRFRGFAGKSPAEIPGFGGLSDRYVYTLGMLLALVLDVAEPAWKERLLDVDGFLIGTVRRVATR